MKEFVKKYRLLFWAEAVVIVVVLISCFVKKEQLLISEDASTWTHTSAEQEQYYKSEPFELKAGVYRLAATACENPTSQIVVGVREYGNSYGGLKANDVPFSEGETFVDFEVYASENLTDVCLVMVNNGASTSDLLNVSLYSTNTANCIMCFWLVVVSLVLNLLLYIRKQYMDGCITTGDILARGILVMGALMACSPWFVDYITMGTNTAKYLARMEMLKEGGLLQASFADLLLVLPAFFRMIGFSVMDSYKMYVFLITIATTAIAYWIVRRCVKSIVAATFVSVAYTLAPFKLSCLYESGNLSGYVAMMFLPLIAGAIFWILGKAFSGKVQNSGKKENLSKGVCIALTLAAFAMGIYHVNEYAYEMKPVRIYSVENPEWFLQQEST